MTASTDTRDDRYREEYAQDFVARWDRLVGWKARADSEGDFFISMLRRQGARRVLDAATGTGFHAVSLAEAGFEVVAVDGAPTMVDKARQNLTERDLDVPCHVADWRRLDEVVTGPFDAIVCLGNSLAHLFDRADLEATLHKFAAVLAPGGLLVLDQRNYDAILDDTLEKMDQSYCCCGGGASVTLDAQGPELVRIHYRIGDAQYQIETHPWRSATISEALEASGFTDIETWGDYSRDYDPSRVEFLIHSARKAA